MDPSNRPPADAAPDALGGVWEEDLRRGQAAEGERGTVEDELAVVRLVRHAVAPADLEPAVADRLLADVERAIRPRRRFLRWPVAVGGLLAGAAAVALWVRVADRRGAADEAPAAVTARAPAPDARSAAGASMSEAPAVAAAPSEASADGGPSDAPEVLEAQFARLEPMERARISRHVASARRGLVDDLVGRLGGRGSAGGMP